MASTDYERGVRDRLALERQRQDVAQATIDNQRKQAEAIDLAQKRKFEAQQSAETRASDLARQKLMTSLVAKGTNNIDALWEAAKVVPFQKVSDQLAVETAHEKANAPAPQFGAATMNLGGETVYGQTNNSGRFFPIKTPTPAKEGSIPIITGLNNGGEPTIKNIPRNLSTNLINVLPPELQTNEFNQASMASQPPRPDSTISSSTPPPDNAPIDNTPSIRQGFLNAAQSAMPAPVDNSNSLPSTPAPQPASSTTVAPRQFKDGSGTIWSYVGSAADPTQDTNPASWQPAQ